MSTFYAHTLPNQPPEKWELLETHLKEVADLAAEFAAPFGASDWARLAGLWHDLGKYHPGFQEYLLRENGFSAHLETVPGRINHSTAGGLWAIQNLGPTWGRVFAFLILGHHAGLADFDSENQPQSSLDYRLKHDTTGTAHIPKEHIDKTPPDSRIFVGDPALWIRMVFSALVDADFLCTEAFMDKSRAKLRIFDRSELVDLNDSLVRHMEGLMKNAKPSTVNKIRRDVFLQCRTAAKEKPAIRTLTVPTGGGKTLSSLAFALEHAIQHQKHRIIYVIPYTSIIEQTANVFRAIPGFENAVLEHHSNVEPEDESRETVALRLASDNWDMPIIVTTSVQFFESLFANRTSRCRKLHNIANSVVIFDEAQNLPQPFLQPVVNCIRSLHEGFEVTPVLCTATQPALDSSEAGGLRNGLESKEIIQNPNELQKRLKRVEVTRHPTWPNPFPLPNLAEELQSHPQVLCIVHKKADAKELFFSLTDDRFHLSTRMCGAHRTDVLKQIQNRLKNGQNSRVVSTQLVEAGVDIDFPVVYRAVAGLDSLAQAAGRCNREGRIEKGDFIVFLAESKPPSDLRAPTDLGVAAISRDNLDDLFSHENFRQFFRDLFWTRGEENLDAKGITKLLNTPTRFEYKFRSAAEAFKLIDDGWQKSVIVLYDQAMKILDDLVAERGNPRILFRKLQRYTVNIPAKEHQRMQDLDYIRPVDPRRFPDVFMQSASNAYHQDVGLLLPDEMIEASKHDGAMRI